MKTLNIKYPFTLIAILILSLNLSAANEIKLVDFVANKVINCVQFYDELKNEKLNFKDEIDVQYFELKSLQDKKVQDKINAHIKLIAKEQIEQDSFYIKLYGSMRVFLDKYYSVNKNEEDALGMYEFDAQRFTPRIEDVEAIPVSLSKDVLCVNFRYKYSASYNNQEHDIIYSEIYYYNTQNGKIYLPKDVFSKGMDKKVSAVLNKKLDDYKKQLLKKATNAKRDEDHQEDKSHRDSNLKVELSDGYLFPTAYSFVYYIPSNAHIAVENDCESISLYFSPSEVKELLNSIGPYAQQSKTILSTQLKNLNTVFLYKNLNSNYSTIFPEDSLFIKRRIKTISITQTQLPRRDESEQKSRVIDTRKLSYSDKGILLKSEQFNDQGELKSYKNFIYNNNLLLRVESFSNGTLSRLENYTYDNNNNLTELRVLTGNEINNIHATLYFYNNNQIITEEHAVNSSERKALRIITVNNKGQNLSITGSNGAVGFQKRSELSYKYDERGNQIASIEEDKLKEYSVYDTQGKMIARTSNDDLQQILYDAKDRIATKIIGRIGTQDERVITYEYNEHNDPIRISHTSYAYDSAQNTTEFSITYEYHKN